MKNPNAREELPVALTKWYDYTKWVLDRVDGLPKNQRFVLGARLADAVLEVMETPAEATYARGAAKAQLLGKANRKIESVRWLVRIGRVIGDRQVLDLIDLIVASHHEREETRWPKGGDLFDAEQCAVGLPIGNLTSQFFANIYLDGFDHFVKQSLRAKGYGRYVDDFLIFGGSRTEVRTLGEAAREYLRGLRLEIHPDKFRVCRTDDGVDFCGFVVRLDGRVKVRESGVRRFKRRYRKLLREARYGMGPLSDITQSVRAWVAHAEHT